MTAYRRLMPLAAASLLVLAVACTSGSLDDESGTPEHTSVVDARVSAQIEAPPANPQPVSQEGRSAGRLGSGVRAVDTVVGAVLARDITTLASLATHQQVACVASGTEDRLGPVCADGSPAGTVVAAFPSEGCELAWNSDAAPVFSEFLDAVAHLHSVARVREQASETPGFGGDYIVVFERHRSAGTAGPPTLGIALFVETSGGITVAYGPCAETGEDLLRRWSDGEPILRGPAGAPLGIRTGIARLDELLDVLTGDDPQATRDEIQFMRFACQHPRDAEQSGVPPCLPGERPGTVVRTVLVDAGCPDQWGRDDPGIGAAFNRHPADLLHVTRYHHDRLSGIWLTYAVEFVDGYVVIEAGAITAAGRNCIDRETFFDGAAFEVVLLGPASLPIDLPDHGK